MVAPGENVEHAGGDVAEVADDHVRVVREASVHQPPDAVPEEEGEDVCVHLRHGEAAHGHKAAGQRADGEPASISSFRLFELRPKPDTGITWRMALLFKKKRTPRCRTNSP